MLLPQRQWGHFRGVFRCVNLSSLLTSQLHCVQGAEPSSAVCDAPWVDGQMDGQTDVFGSWLPCDGHVGCLSCLLVASWPPGTDLNCTGTCKLIFNKVLEITCPLAWGCCWSGNAGLHFGSCWGNGVCMRDICPGSCLGAVFRAGMVQWFHEEYCFSSLQGFSKGCRGTLLNRYWGSSIDFYQSICGFHSKLLNRL